jgi:hypothetical protein
MCFVPWTGRSLRGALLSFAGIDLDQILLKPQPFQGLFGGIGNVQRDLNHAPNRCRSRAPEDRRNLPIGAVERASRVGVLVRTGRRDATMCGTRPGDRRRPSPTRRTSPTSPRALRKSGVREQPRIQSSHGSGRNHCRDGNAGSFGPPCPHGHEAISHSGRDFAPVLAKRMGTRVVGIAGTFLFACQRPLARQRLQLFDELLPTALLRRGWAFPPQRGHDSFQAICWQPR